MTQRGVTGAVQGLGALASVPQNKLDELSADELRSATLQEVSRCGEFSEALADHIDGVIAVRLVRLLRSPNASSSDFRSVDDLIAGISRDKFASQLDKYSKRYFARWSAFRDLLSAARRLEDFAVAVREAESGKPNTAWELVAELVLAAGREGIAFSDVSKRLIASTGGPKGKSGVSHMLTSMRAHGWIDTVTHGRTKRVFAGVGISASSAWRKLNERNELTNVEAAPRRSATRSGDLSRFAELARRVVCLNQGAYIDFSFLAHEHHRELKEMADKIPRRVSVRAVDSTQALTERAKALLSFVDSRFKSVALQNFDLLRQHFQGRSEVTPRICIKGNWSRNSSDKQIVAPIIRDDGSSGDDVTSLADDNTGFREVIHRGRYYSNSDIAGSALLRTYRNPRLDQYALDKLRGRLDLATVESGHGFTADDWLRCWTDWREDADPRKFYRSTLIVPMTLRNNNLSMEFRKKLSERVPQLHLSNYDRSILGFLCLDHPKAGFFNEDDDVAIGYMVADNLSLYTFTRIALTTLSKVFQRTLAASNDLHSPRSEEFVQWMEDLIRQAAPIEASKERPVLEIQSTPLNQLVSLSASFTEAAAQ